jgi:hypothetical protein
VKDRSRKEQPNKNGERIMIELGDKVKHKISGFEGIVIGITHYLSGCDQAGIRPQKLHDGKPISAHWFDVNMIDVIKKGVVKPHTTKGPGGPRDAPMRGQD